MRSPYARAPTPLRLNGAGRKEHRLCGVLGVMTLVGEGRGCLCPSLPCRLLCRSARDGFFLPCATCQPRHALSRQRRPCAHRCTVRCLLCSQRRRIRWACVSGICPSLSSRSEDSDGVSRTYRRERAISGNKDLTGSETFSSPLRTHPPCQPRL